MTLHQNGFEGQSANSAATVANSGNSGSAWTAQTLNGGTAVYSNVRAASGLLSMLVTTDGTNAAFFDDNSFNSTSIAISDCFYYSGAPTSASPPIIQVRTAAGVSAQALILTTGKLQVQDAAGSNAFTTTAGLVAGHWYRIELQIFSDATAGTIALQYYLDNTGTAIQSLSASAKNTRGGNITYIRRGCTASTFTAALPYWNYDNIQAQDGTLTPLGAYSASSAPTASFSYSPSGLDLSVDGTGSSAVSPATISSYAWNFGDSTTASGATPSHTYATAGTYTVTLTVTDSSNATDTTSQTIVISGSSTLHRNGFEGQTANSAATVANSSHSGNGWTSQTLNGGSAVYTNARAIGGSLSLLITTDGTNAAFFDDNSFNSTSIAISDCFYYSGLPNGVAAPLTSVRTTAGIAANLVITTTGRLQAQDSAGSSAVTAVTALTAGHWYRIEMQVFSDATAGTIALQYFLDNTGSAVESLSASAKNTRGGNITYVRRGCSASTYTSALPYWNFDNIQAQDGTTTPIGAYVPIFPPTAAFTHSQSSRTVSVDGSSSAAVSPATISSYAWNFGDSSTGSGITTSHLYASNGSYSVSLTVTDSNGLTNTTSQSVSVTSRNNEMYVYHTGQWINSTLYTYHNGGWVAVQ